MQHHLTDDEVRILEIIQDHYGSHNTADKVFRAGDDEAVIAVTNAAGATAVVVNLTNLAEWCACGTITSDEELKRDWLQIRE